MASTISGRDDTVRLSLSPDEAAVVFAALRGYHQGLGQAASRGERIPTSPEHVDMLSERLLDTASEKGISSERLARLIDIEWGGPQWDARER